MRRQILRSVAALVGLAGVALALSGPAFAQSTVCQQFGKVLEERKGIIGRLQGRKQIHPNEACAMFTKLVANGNAGMKWISANKDWCQIPDAFVENFKSDHDKSIGIRAKACDAAAKFAKMEKQAREAQQAGGPSGGPLGGPGLTGSFKIPQGAL